MMSLDVFLLICLLNMWFAFEMKRNVFYIHSEELCSLSDQFTRCPARASRVHQLITAYDLLAEDVVTVVRPRRSQREDLQIFHGTDFVSFLVECGDAAKDRESPEFLEECELYGLEFECPVLSGLGDYVLLLAGAAIDSALCLMRCGNIVFNWYGGWHHSKKDSAAGFCYINDCVISILTLRKKFDRILYIDLDVHHGDGVEEAFYCTDKVFTLSFHRFSPGLFYPGSGDKSNVGAYKGLNYCLNVPFNDGLTDDAFIGVSKSVISKTVQCFQPNAIVCQCGADALAHDPVEGLNLTTRSYVEVTKLVASFGKPVLFMGGGGYNRSNTAKCWASIQAGILDRLPFDEDMPEHEFFDEYGPTYELKIKPEKKPDKNSPEYLHSLVEHCNSVLSRVVSKSDKLT